MYLSNDENSQQLYTTSSWHYAKKNNEESCMHRRLPLSMPTDTQKYVDHKLHEDKEAIFIEH